MNEGVAFCAIWFGIGLVVGIVASVIVLFFFLERAARRQNGRTW
jgi:hypothetical protein